MKFLRVSIIALALVWAMAMLRATAADNWLIGTWATDTSPAITYVFTATDMTLAGPDGNLGPFKIISYDVTGKTVTVTAEGLPGKSVATMTDATHATFDTGSGSPSNLMKQ